MTQSKIKKIFKICLYHRVRYIRVSPANQEIAGKMRPFQSSTGSANEVLISKNGFISLSLHFFRDTYSGA